MFRVRGLIWLLVLAVAAVGCRADADVTVSAEADGSGVVDVDVTLDGDAASGLLDLQETGLSLNDLAQSGWDIRPPTEQSNGRMVLGGSKAFGTPEQFSEIMAEISGPDGMFADLELTRDHSFARVDLVLAGTIDVDGFESFSDPALERALGSSVADVVAAYGVDPASARMRLIAEMPGEPVGDADSTGVISAGASGESDTTTVRWTFDLSEQEPIEVAFSTVERNMAPLVLRGVAVLLGVLAAVLVLGQVLGLFSPSSSSRSKGRPTTAAEPVATPEESETPAEPVGPAVVAIDGMGVLYRNGRDTTEVLIPFLRELGVSVPADEIRARTRKLSLGRITPGDFWSGFGLTADPNSLDEAYLARHQLTPGVVRFLRESRSGGVALACISNDCTEWATKLRTRHSLDALIDTWVISGSVGVRKPDKPIFEVLRRIVGHPPSEILIIDDELHILDAARDLGFQTLWFAGDDADENDSNGHNVLRTFVAPQPSA